MKITAYGLLIFFICLNSSLYLINQTDVLAHQQSPYIAPNALAAENLIPLALSILGVGGLLSRLTGNLLFGGTLAMIIFAVTVLFTPAQWILFGFPIFLGQILPSSTMMDAVVVVIQSLFSAVWFWFLLGLIGQRSTWEQ